MFLETKRDGETTTKPDIYALPTLIAWLEKQPAAKTYNFGDCEGACLLGQYIIAHGIKWKGNEGIYCRMTMGPQSWDEIARTQPWTFGAALARARELAAHAEGAASK